MAIITETIKITGMTCGHCQKFVYNVLKDLPGVKESEVSLENKYAVVTFDDDKITKDAIVKAVNDTQSYHAE